MNVVQPAPIYDAANEAAFRQQVAQAIQRLEHLLTQGAAIADVTGGAVQDAEARTALNALLAQRRATGVQA